MKYFALAGMLLLGVFIGNVLRPFRPAVAQESSSRTTQQVMSMNMVASDQDIELMRRDLRAKRQKIIGENLRLNDQEASKFWPLYNHYVNDLKEVNNEKYRLFKDYATKWDTMNDQDALIYIRRWLEVDQRAHDLRLKYVPIVSQVLTGKETATFFQLDRRVSLMIDVQQASQIPLAQSKN